MLEDNGNRLIPEIQPRAEPEVKFRSFGDKAEGKEGFESAHAGERSGKFVGQTARDSGMRASDTVSAFDNTGGSLTRSGRRQRAGRLREGRAEDGGFRFSQAEDTGMVTSGMNHRRQRKRFAEMAAAEMRHSFVQATDHYEDDENSSVNAAEDAGIIVDEGIRDLARHNRQLRMRRSERFRQAESSGGALFFDGTEYAASASGAYAGAYSGGAGSTAVAGGAEKQSRIRRYYQKQRYKRMYAERKALESGQAVHMSQMRLSTRITAALKQTFAAKKRTALVLGIILLMALLIMAAVSSCTASIHGLTSAFLATTYPSTDEDIYAVEEYYESLEAKLNDQIIRIEDAHPGYDEYLYQVDEISHNPYHLISYFTVKYGEFTFDQVKGELKEIFNEQYSISTSESTQEVTEIVTETVDGEEVETEVTKTVRCLTVTMTNHDLDEVLRARLSKDEREYYKVLNATYGNRSYLFDLDSLTTYSPRGAGITYQVPPEALTDERVRRMIREAEKYLGYPYVWGGSSPATSFDCSGFVSWVINHCGNGWNVGRLGAEGLRQRCVAVSPSNAKPGDLIFFQNTYPCGPGASHVGIYVGNGMMIHCGDPIQYTSIKSAYWQQHFLSFGRIRG